MSADALQRLRGAAREAQVDVADLGMFLGALPDLINDSIGHATDAAEAFQALGTPAERLQKMSPSAVVSMY